MKIKIDYKNECWHCKFKEEVPGNCHISCVNPDPNMKGNLHGIKQGWFMYPLLFDPTWKEKKCDNYENADAVNHAINRSVSENK